MSEQLKELLNEKQEGQVGVERNVSEETKACLVENQDRLLRLKQVLKIVPVSKSTWWAGCASGRFPEPVRLGRRITCWRAKDIRDLLNSLEG
jgi:prophage regulatory protein